MRNKLATTTALVASLALAFPAPIMAQSEGETEVPVCPDDLSDEDCAALQAEAELEAELEAQMEADAAAEAEGAVEEAEGTVEEVVEEAPVAEEVVEEVPAADEAVEEVTEEAPAEEAVEEAPAEDMAEEAPAEAVEETPAEEVVEETPAVEAEAEAEVQAEAEAEVTEDAPAEEAAAEEDIVEETPAEDVAEDAPAEEVMADEDMAEEAAADETPAEDVAEEEVANPETPAEPSNAETAAASGEAETTMAAEASAEGGDAEVEEVTEVVTEETTRRSDEDFTASAAANADSGGGNGNDGGGLTNLQAALLGAVGGAVVGSLLSGDREVVSSAPDRVVVRDPSGNLQVLRDDDAILRQPGSEVTTQRFSDGSTRTIVRQPDGSQVVTIRSPEYRVLRRSIIGTDGREIVLFDDTQSVAAVDVSTLPQPQQAPQTNVSTADQDALRAALMAAQTVDRGFSLAQVREIERVRYLAAAVQVNNITFETGSAAVRPSEAEELLALGQLMADQIAENPGEVFLIEGHTDAVGNYAYNLALSDRRAESVALALTEYFNVPPENMVLQGYGESDLLVPTTDAERANRRAAVRRITPLLQNGS